MRPRVHMAVCPATGLHLREATPAEVAAYLTGNAHTRGEAFHNPVLVGAVLVDLYTGPGLWFGGAGF